MKINIKKLRDRAEKATPGPWEFERVGFDDGSFSYEINTDHRLVSFSELNYEKKPMQAKFDADHVSAANPATILTLIDAIEVARETLKRVYEDDETGHWGPDVTMKSVLENALAKIEECVE